MKVVNEYHSFLNLIAEPNVLIIEYQNYCFSFFLSFSFIVSSLKLLGQFCPELVPLELIQSILQSNSLYPQGASSTLIQFFQSSLPVLSTDCLLPGDLLLSYNPQVYTFNNTYTKNYSFYVQQLLKDLAMNDYSILFVAFSGIP